MRKGQEGGMAERARLDVESGAVAQSIVDSRGPTSNNRFLTLLHLPPLRFHCADGCWDRMPRTVATVVHWQSDALLNNRLDLNNRLYHSHSIGL